MMRNEPSTLTTGSAAHGCTLPDRAVVALSGPGTVEFLQGLLTNDTRPVLHGQPVYAGLLTPQGKVITDMILLPDWRADPGTEAGDALLIDCAADHAETLVKRLRLYRLRAKIGIAPVPDLAVGVAWRAGDGGGPAGIQQPEPSAAVFADPRRETVVRAYGSPDDIAGALAPFGTQPDAWMQYRLQHALGEGAEIEGLFWLETNAEALHGVDFKKGCYVGQELTARMKHKAELRKRVLPLGFADVAPDRGTALTSDGKDAATVLAGSGKVAIALVRVDRVRDGGGVLLHGDSPVEILWPKWLAANPAKAGEPVPEAPA